jgi:uncharacterized FlaG/YvyC family protein
MSGIARYRQMLRCAMTDAIQSLTIKKKVSLDQHATNGSLCAGRQLALHTLSNKVMPPSDSMPELTPDSAPDSNASQKTQSLTQCSAQSVKSFLQNRHRALVFHLNTETGSVTTTVLDGECQQIIRHIHLEQALKLIV